MIYTTILLVSLSCSPSDIGKFVRELQPSMEHGASVRLSNAICDSAKKYGVPPEVLTSVLSVESRFKVRAYNKRTKDYGIAQINQRNIEQLGLEKSRLLKDLEYSVDSGALILSWFFKTYSNVEPEKWVCRYNVGTRKLTGNIGRICKRYVKLVKKRLKVWENITEGVRYEN